jgi:hypothetical protein
MTPTPYQFLLHAIESVFALANGLLALDLIELCKFLLVLTTMVVQ